MARSRSRDRRTDPSDGRSRQRWRARADQSEPARGRQSRPPRSARYRLEGAARARRAPAWEHVRTHGPAATARSASKQERGCGWPAPSRAAAAASRPSSSAGSRPSSAPPATTRVFRRAGVCSAAPTFAAVASRDGRSRRTTFHTGHAPPSAHPASMRLSTGASAAARTNALALPPARDRGERMSPLVLSPTRSRASGAYHGHSDRRDVGHRDERLRSLFERDPRRDELSWS
jgi:hypothetical protein